MLRHRNVASCEWRSFSLSNIPCNWVISCAVCSRTVLEWIKWKSNENEEWVYFIQECYSRATNRFDSFKTSARRLIICLIIPNFVITSLVPTIALVQGPVLMIPRVQLFRIILTYIVIEVYPGVFLEFVWVWKNRKGDNFQHWKFYHHFDLHCNQASLVLMVSAVEWRQSKFVVNVFKTTCCETKYMINFEWIHSLWKTSKLTPMSKVRAICVSFADCGFILIDLFSSLSTSFVFKYIQRKLKLCSMKAVRFTLLRKPWKRKLCYMYSEGNQAEE